MATQFEPKEQFVKLLRKIAADGESGVLSVVTDAQRSVVLRFLDGRLTHAMARAKDVREAAQVLAQAKGFRFNFAAGRGESRQELIPAEDFIRLIEGGATGASGVPATPTVAAPAPDKSNPRQPYGGVSQDQLRQVLTELAVEHIGPMAAIVVDQAMEERRNLEAIIDDVAAQIPGGGGASAFRELVWRHLTKR